MKQYKYLALVGIILFFLSSCTDNYESAPVEQYSIDFVFSKTDSAGVEAKRFLNDIYLLLNNGHNRVGSDYLDAASDDAISIDDNAPDVYKLAIGRYSASSLITSDMKWSDYYTGIRRANIFIKNIDVVPFNYMYKNALGEMRPLNYTLKAEARFLRAYFYFELVKRYGGVPLMGDSIYVLGDNMELPRNKFSDCIDYIVNELDTIENDLRSYPIEDATAYAHVPTKEACEAFKSRVLLYAASPLFNENPIEAGNELVGYASYDKERWNKAAEAAKTFIDSYGPNGNGAFRLSPDFRDTFLGFYNTSTNPEMIFFVQGSNDTSVETNNGPLGFTGNALGKGRTLPTQNLVDAFPMKDGKAIDESSKYTYDPSKPYDNRDPRLNYTVLHNGSQWLGSVLQTYQGGANNPSSSAQYSKTSYYMCKFMGKYASSGTVYGNNYHLWVVFRYAEILLNYAEAENEYLSAPSVDVYNAIIELRKRVGIEAGDDNLYGLKPKMTQSEMRTVIQNERRIEMAFEEQRYWDIRRWRLAENIFTNPLKGMVIVSSLGSLSFNEVDVLSVTFDTKRYLYPIPYSEVIKNKNMIQNPKW
jgi:hypothetical protein